MKKIILSILIVLYCIGLSIVSLTSVPIAAAEPVNCWQQHMAADGCTPQYTVCAQKCPNDASSAQRACEDACSKASKACRDESLAAYRACVNAQQKGQQTSETRKLQPYPGQLEQFLEDVRQQQIAIDQCPPPRIPSESACVSEILSQFELSIYLKDVAIEPDFTNTIIIDESKVQIISLPEGIKETPSYLMNSISTNLPDFSEDFKIPATDLEKLPILNLSPVTTTGVILPDQSYTIVESSGLSAVIEPGSKYQNWQSLVTLDKDAVGVGGPAITSVTKMVLASDAKVTLADFPKKSVMEVSDGARIVVAGFSADDTLEAAKDFVNALK